MSPQTHEPDQPASRSRDISRVITFITFSLSLIVITALVTYVVVHKARPVVTTTTLQPPVPKYPIGVADTASPSGMAPPSANGLPGYQLSYLADFNGSSLPTGWDIFTGVPGGDPGGHFGLKHVVVSGGLLTLGAWRDPEFKNNWVTGGLCQCGSPRLYGAFFVRSRITASGPNEVELLWPANNSWPPEVDFSETGGSKTDTSATVHFGIANHIFQSTIKINMLAWHTWGVVWTPTSLTYTLDGFAWGSIRSSQYVPSIPMTLDFEQRALCSIHLQCPHENTSMQIDWVAEYQAVH